MRRLTAVLCGGASLAVLLHSGEVRAQSTAPQDDGATAVEDVVVHSRRRAELLADVPVAVTALNQQALEDASVARIEDIGTLAPNVFIKSSSSGAASIEVLIRGQIVAISNPANDPPVGLYYDDVYVAQSKGAGGSVFDLQDVEISRGVQGTLSGRNNTGGAIRFYSHKPVLNAFEGSVSGSLGSNNLYRGSAIVNLPFGDTFAVRAGWSINHQDEQGHSVITGQPVQGVHQELVRVGALWQPTTAFSNHFVYEHSKIDQPQQNLHAVGGTNVACAVVAGTTTCPPSTAVLNPYRVQYPIGVVIPASIHDNSWNFVTGGDKVDVDFLRNTTSLDLTSSIQAKLIVGYRDMVALSSLDVDASPGFVAHASNFGATSKQLTIEPQILGSSFDDRLEWTAGYFYFQDKAVQTSTTFVGLAGPATLQLNILDKLINTSNAVYAHTEYKLTPSWRVAAGLRYTEDKREYTPNRAFGTPPALSCALQNPAGTNIAPGVPCPVVNLEANFDYVSYELTTNYAFNDHLNGYFRMGRGQKSGGFTSPITAINTPAFRPEQLDDYEIGLKATGLFGGVVDANIALFYGDYADLQRYTSSLIPGSGISSQTLNVGAATIKGVEFDAAWRVTDNLTVSGYVGYTDAAYDEFLVRNGAGNLINLTNNAWYQTPEITSRLNVTYDVPISVGSLRVGGSWYHQSSSSLYVLEFPQLIQKAYSLFDARLTWTSPDETWDFAIWGTNLADEDYAVGATASPADGFDPSKGLNSAAIVPGDERTIGATLTLHWGN